jgi:hypothetical protein
MQAFTLKTMPLNNYSYSHASYFLKNPTKSSNHMSFKGEVYEAAFYECKVEASGNDNASESCNLIAKGPYAPKVKKFVSTGFFCDPKGSVIYNSNKISLAEFDCLEISNDSLFFYECTLTQKPESLRILEKEALRKISLLKKLFPSRSIVCTVVSDNEITLRRFGRMKEFKTLIFPFPTVDLFDLARNSQQKAKAPSPNMRSPNSINNLVSKFDYHREVVQLSLLLNRNSLFSIEKNIRDSNGVFERLYWGAIPAADYIPCNKKINSEHVIVSVNFSKINAPALRYYFFDKNNGSPYEVGNPPKKLSRFKNSRSELIALKTKLSARPLEDLRKLEGEICEWHNRALQQASH